MGRSAPALTSGQHQRYVDDASSLRESATVDDGNAILGHILGSKDVSRQVAAQAAAQTGVGADVLRRMLPMAATLVMGALAQHAARSPSASASSLASGAPPDLMGLLGAAMGGPSQGSGLSSVVGMLSRFLGGRQT